MKSTRESYGDTLIELGSQVPNLVVLDADLSVSTKTGKFRQEYPGRFFNVGCAEQNLMGIAAGLAIAGRVVFASTFSIFTHRAWEQIRNIVAHDRLNVKIAGSHSGLTASKDGASHQSLEDLALMRVIPNMSVIVPADATETRLAVISEASRAGPAYIRLNREATPSVYTEEYEFACGKAVQLMDGHDLTLIATGTMVHKVVEAGQSLHKGGLGAKVLNVHTIKPIDRVAIIEAAQNTGAIVTVEEHSIFGGLGSAVAEVVMQECPVPMTSIGVGDQYGESGSYEELLGKHGLTVPRIIEAARTVTDRKTK